MTGIERLCGVVEFWKHNQLEEIVGQIEREQVEAAADHAIVASVASEMERHVSGAEGMEDSPVYRWARELREALGGDGRAPTEYVSVSAYDLPPQEDREAIAWVREHGGLDHVRSQWGYLKGRANHADHVDRQLEKRQRQIDESHAALRRRNERIVELEHERDELREMVRSLNALTDEMEKRLMPDGMEWPMVDGKLVDFTTGYEPSLGVLEAVSIYSNGACEVMGHDGIIKNVKDIHVSKPKVLDADGAEIEVGDDLYSVEGGLKLHVGCIDTRNGKIATAEMYALDKWADPAMYTHRAPVLAADGKPLREGETVWGTKGGSYHLTSVHDGKVFARHVGGSFGAEVESAGGEGLYRLRADQLTHERPESWERLEEDAKDIMRDIAVYLGDYSQSDFKEPGDSIQDRVRDLVRRAKALAGGAK